MQKDVNLAWAAGFIDGEGCIYVAKTYQKNSFNGIRYELRVSVSQVDIKPLKKLKSLFGGYLLTRKNRHINEWYISSSNAVRMLEKILPHLIYKKDEAKEALKFKSTLLKINRYSLNKEFIHSNRELIYNKLQSMKDIKYAR